MKTRASNQLLVNLISLKIWSLNVKQPINDFQCFKVFSSEMVIGLNFKMRKRKSSTFCFVVFLLSTVAISVAESDVGRAEAQLPAVAQPKQGKFQKIWMIKLF